MASPCSRDGACWGWACLVAGLVIVAAGFVALRYLPVLWPNAGT